ncbi:hypothetical protein AYO38_05770 [bacterium SCGC AG-212-C10]|nr:hypothetical protein AYO38_05770 [bacterium SCGC AG-212-C10]
MGIVLAYVTLRTVQTSTSVISEYDYAPDLEVAVSQSHLIVTGKATGESRDYKVEVPSADGSHAVAGHTIRVWTVSVTEVLKGGVAEGSSIAFAQELEYWHLLNGQRVDGESEVTELSAGETYTLLVAQSAKPAYYPAEVPTVLYAKRAEPGLAAVANDETLEFLVSDEYVKEQRAAGRLVGDARVPTAFQTSLPALRALVADLGTRPPTPLPVEQQPRTPESAKQTAIAGAE